MAKTDWTGSKIVLFDLETCTAFPSYDICQISAATNYKTDNKNLSFNACMSTNCKALKATKIDGLQRLAGIWYLNDKRLYTVSQGLQEFIKFLKKIGNKIILVGHNGFRFDAPRILHNMEECKLLEDFKSVVKGFADTLQIFRDSTNLIEYRKNNGKFDIASLAKNLLGTSATIGLHEAQNDVKVLRQLIIEIRIKNDTIRTAAKTTEEIIQNQKNLMNKRALSEILGPVVSLHMIDKIAKAGITLKMLEKEYAYGGKTAVKELLSEDIEGQPRVTRIERIIEEVVQQLEHYLNYWFN